MSNIQNIGALPSFEEMLSSLAVQAIVTQRRLDEKYVSMRRDFAEFTPLSHLVAMFEPVRIAMHAQSIDCRFSTGSDSLRGVRLVNQVIDKRYRAQSITHSVHLARC